MKNILKSHNIFTLIFAVVVALAVVWTPIFGLGDLSEYTSTFESVGLYNAGNDAFAISQNYGISQPDGSAKTPFQIFLMAIIYLNKLLFSKTVFNIHFLSTVYCLIFLAGAYFLQKNIHFEKNYLNYVFSALFGLVFLDLGYLAYFNSFYTEALMFALIIAMAALATSMAKKFSYFKVIALCVCACLFSGMRVSAAVTTLFIGALLIVFALETKKKIVTVVAGGVTALVAVVALLNPFVPARDVKLYSLIYNDFAVADGDALEFFGLEEAKSATPSMAEMSEAVADVTYGDVVRYYVKNPKMFSENIKSASNNSYFLIQEFASYREAGADYGFREQFPLKIWNSLKKHLPQGWVVILVFLVAYAVVAAREYIKNKEGGRTASANIALFAVALPVGALSELLGVTITTGKILVSKNMFAFGIYFDLMVVTAVVWATATMISRNEHIKSKYGVNQ